MNQRHTIAEILGLRQEGAKNGVILNPHFRQHSQSRVASSLWLEKVGPQAQRYNYNFTHLPFCEDSSTAASTRWFFKPSSNVGWTGLPSTQAFTKSAATWMNVCS